MNVFKPTTKFVPALTIAVLLCSVQFLKGQSVKGDNNQSNPTDTIFAGNVLPNAKLIKNTHSKFSLLIYANHTYASIKLLDRDVKIAGENLFVVQKLYNAAVINTDSVISNKQTLMPVESYSNISTSKDSFVYKGNRLTGTILAKENKGTVKNIDTLLTKQLFNGLIYIETYQALTYKKNHPFYLAEYVPGHGSIKLTRIEYIADDEITVAGTKIVAKLLELKTGPVIIHCWLDGKSQELLKMEGKFPKFEYLMLRLI